MSDIGQRKIRTQQRVIAFFQDALGYAYLGHWKGREGNSNVEQALLTVGARITRAVVGCLLLLASQQLPAGEQLRLPPEQCLRQLRSARILGMQGEADAQLATLHVALASFPLEIAPIYALLELHREHPLPTAEFDRFRALLAARLEDPESDLPVAVLRNLVDGPAVEDERLELVIAHAGRRLASGTGGRAELLDLLAAAQVRLGDTAAAVESLQQLRALAPSETVTWQLYRGYVELERWDEALAVFEQFLDREQVDLLEIHLRLLGRAGQVEKQRMLIERSIEAARSDPAPSDNVWLRFADERRWLSSLADAAWDLRDAGRDAEASALFARLVELDPGNEGARGRWLYLYGSGEERRQAAAAKAVRLQQLEDPFALYGAGTSLLAAGDPAGALELLERAAPALPELEACWYNLGLAAFQTEAWQTAASSFAHALELNAERAESAFFRGMALNQLSDCAGSVTALERALELGIDRQLTHYYLARCYRTLGDGISAEHHSRLYAESQQD